MGLKVSPVDVWAGTIKDVPEGMSQELEALAAGGASLEFAIARRAPDKPGTGVLFVAPLAGAKQLKAAKAAGMKKCRTMAPLRVAGPDKRGLGAKLTRMLADAGINVRGMSAASIGKQFVLYLSFDSKADSNKAARILKKF